MFTVASLLCGLATTGPALVAFRFVQGVGGGLGSAVVLGMIVAAYPEPRGRARAIGAFSFVGAAGASIGVIVGGVLTQAVSWHWIFLVNVPFGVARRAARRPGAPAGPGPRAAVPAAGSARDRRLARGGQRRPGCCARPAPPISSRRC